MRATPSRPFWFRPELLPIDRLPRRPYCTDDFERGLRIRDRQRALTYRHLSLNPPHLKSWLTFDVDRPEGWRSWADCNLPAPTWAASNPKNGHAHLAYGLTVPVLLRCNSGAPALEAPMRYCEGIESLMTQRLSADPAYGGLMTKNPLHPCWQVWFGPQASYTLGELAEWLPGLEKHRPRRGTEAIGIGRNRALLDELRAWALKAIRQYWGSGNRGWELWREHCYRQALALNVALFAAQHLHESEVRHVARSVAGWVWRNTSAAGFSEFQSRAGKRSGAARRAQSEGPRATARLMRANGRTLREIAGELGVSLGTAHAWTK